MIIDLSISSNKHKAKSLLDFYCIKDKTIELKIKRKKRSLSQNRYLHLILSYFGVHYGYTLEEVKKDIFKKHVNHDIFYDGEKDSIISISCWRSSSDLTKEELSICIDRFLRFSSEFGLDLPEPSDLNFINEIENDLKNIETQKYL